MASSGVSPPALRVLSLTGGGYRGLFTAEVLVQLEQQIAPRRLYDCFDVFVGTSVGGLIAAGLSVGIPSERIRDSILELGPTVFPVKRGKALRRACGPLFEATPIRRGVKACLGVWADRQMREVPKGLLICAIGWISGRPEIFRSSIFGDAYASAEKLIDVCLATSAAPTFFPAHTTALGPMLDGGLVVNNPDSLALLECMSRWPHRTNAIEMFSIGTAGTESGGMAGNVPSSGFRWSGVITEFMISAQERLAAQQVRDFLGPRYMRINHKPAIGQLALSEMSVVDNSMTQTLMSLAIAAVADARAGSAADLGRFLRAPSNAVITV